MRSAAAVLWAAAVLLASAASSSSLDVQGEKEPSSFCPYPPYYGAKPRPVGSGSERPPGDHLYDHHMPINMCIEHFEHLKALTEAHEANKTQDGGWANVQYAYKRYKAHEYLDSTVSSFAVDGVQWPAFMVGDLFGRTIPLRANVNNYAPDNFSDKEIAQLFALHEKVRARLAADKTVRERLSHADTLLPINQKLLEHYVKAIAGMPRASDHRRPSSRADEECSICRDTADDDPEAWVTLPCKHAFHADCLENWDKVLNDNPKVCPACREWYRLPFEFPESDQLD